MRWQIASIATAGLAFWLTVIFTIRYTLRLLLIYKGWMYEARGKGRRISLRTKLWVVLVKFLSGVTKPQLYSFQGSLPRLPLPPIEDTMARVRERYVEM